MTISQFPGETRSAPALAHTLPQRVGIGLKPQHHQLVLDSLPALGFFEVHAENYLVAGGPFHHYLEQIRSHYPLSIHGVGLSIGAEQPLDEQHLERLCALLERYQPQAFSEHLAWSSHANYFLNDLLPLAYDASTLSRVCEHIDRVQSRLQRPMLLENPSTYLEYRTSSMDEASFIREVIQRTGCGLLLDVNNLYVSCINHHWDIQQYLQTLPLHAVGELHLAGFAEDRDSAGDRLLIDSHGAAVDSAVWQLYQQVLGLIGPCATLIERDNDIPPFEVLLAEAQQAERLLVQATQAPQRDHS